jgi:hypothetical protein
MSLYLKKTMHLKHTHGQIATSVREVAICLFLDKNLRLMVHTFDTGCDAYLTPRSYPAQDFGCQIE